MASSAFSDLLDLIARLRDPTDGCPWDRAQDHASLRPYMLEEAYEAIAAIDSGDPKAIASELGDVLLQVVLHSQIAAESGAFSIDDVIAGLSEKLRRRHPHVFGDASNDLPSIHRRWEEIKAQEGAEKGDVPILVRARKAVYVLAKLERLDLLHEDDDGRTEEERAGYGIPAAIGQAWRDGLDPELALR
ncbi:MazG family protein, partial [Candidatus Bipolaricaulota bacterium]|nr:MazG family protein [Candidatus Bipolaricaulota bacterium]